MEKTKIQSFTDLLVWQKAHSLVLEVYRLTKMFPKDELFSLVSQLRRAVISITSNIAEGFGRISEKEKLHFYSFAYGSLLEVKNQILVSKDLNYLKIADHNKLEEQITEVAKMLQGLIKSIKLKPHKY
jgi:four helix bundle protein